MPGDQLLLQLANQVEVQAHPRSAPLLPSWKSAHRPEKADVPSASGVASRVWSRLQVLLRTETNSSCHRLGAGHSHHANDAVLLAAFGTCSLDIDHEDLPLAYCCKPCHTAHLCLFASSACVASAVVHCCSGAAHTHTSRSGCHVQQQILIRTASPSKLQPASVCTLVPALTAVCLQTPSW